MGVDQTGLVAAPDSGAHPVDADSAEVARVPRLRRYAPPGRPF
jgi:hypothetical protein